MRMSAYLALGRALLLVSALRTHTYTLLLKTLRGSNEVTINTYYASVIILYLLPKDCHGFRSMVIYHVSFSILALELKLIDMCLGQHLLYTQKLSICWESYLRSHRTVRRTEQLRHPELQTVLNSLKIATSRRRRMGTSLLSLPRCKVFITSSVLHLPLPCLWVTSSLPGWWDGKENQSSGLGKEASWRRSQNQLPTLFLGGRCKGEVACWWPAKWQWCPLASVRERRSIICGLIEGWHRSTQRWWHLCPVNI